jgi:hypothetical protein
MSISYSSFEDKSVWKKEFAEESARLHHNSSNKVSRHQEKRVLRFGGTSCVGELYFVIALQILAIALLARPNALTEVYG